MTERAVAILTSCDRRMFRYMAGEDCGGIDTSKEDMKVMPLNKLTNFDVAGLRPTGCPRKPLRRTVEDDMRVVGAQYEDALD